METVKEHCKHKDCAYRGHVSPMNTSTDETCDYVLLEGHPRGCPISQCDKYRKGKRKMTRKLNQGIKWVVE